MQLLLTVTTYLCTSRSSKMGRFPSYIYNKDVVASWQCIMTVARRWMLEQMLRGLMPGKRRRQMGIWGENSFISNLDLCCLWFILSSSLLGTRNPYYLRISRHVWRWCSFSPFGWDMLCWFPGRQIRTDSFFCAHVCTRLVVGDKLHLGGGLVATFRFPRAPGAWRKRQEDVGQVQSCSVEWNGQRWEKWERWERWKWWKWSFPQSWSLELEWFVLW